MAEKPFDPTRGVRFDLASGSVTTGTEHTDSERVVLVPALALFDLAKNASTATVEAVARALGRAIGERAKARLANGAAESIEAFANQLGGELAVAGCGSLAIERWGRAMVVLVEHCTLPDAMIAPAIAAAVEASTGREVGVALLMSERGTARVLVSSKSAVGRVRGYLEAGASWGDALARLHGTAS